jgi:hypothetical protein
MQPFKRKGGFFCAVTVNRCVALRRNERARTVLGRDTGCIWLAFSKSRPRSMPVCNAHSVASGRSNFLVDSVILKHNNRSNRSSKVASVHYCPRDCLAERLQFTFKLEVTTSCRRAFVTSISQAFGSRNLAIGTQNRLVSTRNPWLRDILPSCVNFLARQDGVIFLLGLCVEGTPTLPAVISGFCGHRPTATRPCAGRTRSCPIPTLTLWNQFRVAVRHH